ncbi:MAG: hypothetical protein K8R28_03410 [Desulfobacterales bacterium]|nr:hypothetical protein [Desulfobacterales bacterium]
MDIDKRVIKSLETVILFINEPIFKIKNVISFFIIKKLYAYGWFKNVVTTHVVRLKLFRLKAEEVRRARLPYFGENI